MSEAVPEHVVDAFTRWVFPNQTVAYNFERTGISPEVVQKKAYMYSEPRQDGTLDIHRYIAYFTTSAGIVDIFRVVKDCSNMNISPSAIINNEEVDK